MPQHELAELLKEKELLPLIYEVNERVSKGIKKELLPIVKLGRHRTHTRQNPVQRRISRH